MRRLIREGNPPSGQLASPVPQYWNPSTEAFEDVLGAHGAPRSILYGPNGQPISQSNPLEVRARGLEAELATMRGLLETGDAKVTLTGRVDALRGSFVTGAKTVTSTAAEIFAGSNRLSGRHAMVITNTGNNTVYIGTSTVSASNGFPVFPQDTIRIEFDPQSSVAVFAVSDGPNVGVRVVELA